MTAPPRQDQVGRDRPTPFVVKDLGRTGTAGRTLARSCPGWPPATGAPTGELPAYRAA